MSASTTMPNVPSSLNHPNTPTTTTGFPHNYSGATKKMTFTTHFTFTHPDHVQEKFPAGIRDVPVEVANHWYAMAHSDTPPEMQPQPGTPAYAEARRQELLAYTQRNFDQTQQDMTRAADINKKAIEEQVRLQTTDKIRAEMQAEFDAKVDAAVKKALAAAQSSPDDKKTK